MLDTDEFFKLFFKKLHLIFKILSIHRISIIRKAQTDGFCILRQQMERCSRQLVARPWEIRGRSSVGSSREEEIFASPFSQLQKDKRAKPLFR